MRCCSSGSKMLCFTVLLFISFLLVLYFRSPTSLFLTPRTSSAAETSSTLPHSHSLTLLFSFLGHSQKHETRQVLKLMFGWVQGKLCLAVPPATPGMATWYAASTEPPSSCSPATHRTFHTSKSFGDPAAFPEGEQFGFFSAVQASTARTGILCSTGWDLVGMLEMSKPGWMGHWGICSNGRCHSPCQVGWA